MSPSVRSPKASPKLRGKKAPSPRGRALKLEFDSWNLDLGIFHPKNLFANKKY